MLFFDMPTQIHFWFEFASSYSYLSVMRIDAEARKRDLDIKWRPFLLGPIFSAQGWNTSPFKIYLAKGENMWRDMERQSAKYNIPFTRPSAKIMKDFPRNGILAARLCLVGLEGNWGKAFARLVFQAEFDQHMDIANPDSLAALVEQSGGSVKTAFEMARSLDIKNRLKANVQEAMAANIFGAPTFTIGRELFWGDDRLEDALDWALR